MLTGRGWWLLLVVASFLMIGMLARMPLLTLVGLTLLLWFLWEWMLFISRVGVLPSCVKVEREVLDDRGPVTTLWAGRGFQVHTTVRADRLRLAYVLAVDFPPLDAERDSEQGWIDGPLDEAQHLHLRYSIRLPHPGIARFEGVRLQVSDLQGFFYHVAFVAAPVELPVLPPLLRSKSTSAGAKRFNLLPPPGQHRLRRPGSGSELLDLRDYLPGDPPKTIAWKVSARRDRLITKEFESEVPIRCTLFVDVSASVRVPSVEGKAVTRLAELAAGAAQSTAGARDLTGLCLFDEQGIVAWRKPDRSPRHLSDLLRLCAAAAALPPAESTIDPEPLLPLAYTFARDVYPHLLHPSLNTMPLWVSLFTAFPSYTRRQATLAQTIHRRKWLAWLLCPPIISAVVYVLALACSERMRRHARWRKQLAALLAVRYELGGDGLAALLEDDDRFTLHLQRFLSDHRVPFGVPLYDENGEYRHAAPGKIETAAGAILRAVAHGQDVELYVLMIDLLELDDEMEPLLQAVRVALARHHQVIVLCPWPPGLPIPSRNDNESEPVLDAAVDTVDAMIRRMLRERFHAAYHRIRRRFGRLGVAVVCAASNEAAPLILDRLERLHRAGRKA